MKRNLSLFFALTAALVCEAAFAQDLIEKVVVRNRLYSTSGRMELGVNVGLTLMSRLTDNINLNAHGAYNLTDTMAVELRGGWGITRHTGLANQIAVDFAANSSIKTANDLSELWELTGNGAIGFRWSPIYGKISLMAELPVHFQAYIWLGAGGGLLKRESLVYCEQGTATTCDSYRTENKFSPLGSLALGARFFASGNHSISLEVRDWSYPDAYLDNINRAEALAGRETGEPNRSPGIINLVQFDLGYSYIF